MMMMVLTSVARRLLVPTALALAVLAIPAAPASAQQTDCQCVDSDGNTIENCSCFRSPRFRTVFGGFGDDQPRIGVSVDAGQSAQNDARGARVTDVLEDGPADDAGLRVGDVITSIDGQSLFQAIGGDAEDDFDLDQSIPVQRLLAIARELEPGEQVVVEYTRGDEARSATVEAEELSSWNTNFTFVSPNWDADAFEVRMEEFGDRMRNMSFEFDGRELETRMEELSERLGNQDWSRLRVETRPDASLFSDDAPQVLTRLGDLQNLYSFGFNSVAGVEMMELNPDLGSYFGATEGVLVTDVDEDSTLGLEAGDVVLRIGDREVTTPEELRRILRSYNDDEEITLHIMRDRSELRVAGRLGG